MTIYTDAATISTKTTPSSVEAAAYVDLDTVESITQVLIALGTDVGPYHDSAVITSRTTLVGSYLTETFTIHTTDYNWSPWSIAYSYDGSIPTTGCVGMFDDDQGFIT